MQSLPQSYKLEADMAAILSSHRYSQHWYQRKWLAIVLVAITIYILGIVSITLFGLHPPLSLSLISMVVVVVALVCDVISTDRLVKVAPEYEKRGVEPWFHETNPLLPSQPTLKQQVWHVTTLLHVVVVLGVYFIPLPGWGFAAGSFLAALNNTRYRKQALYELQLHDMMPTRGEWEKKRDASRRHLLPSRPVLVRDS